MHLGTLAFCLVLVVAPLAAEAQNLPRIGLLSIGADPSRPVAWSPFLERLRELGYVEGGNITIERRFAAGRPERLDELVADLAHLRVDIIVATGVPENLAAKRAMPTTPIVMMVVPDPVGEGLVASLARPGGNVTGLSTLAPELYAKRLELLKEAIPAVTRVGLLSNPANAHSAAASREITTAARVLGVQIHGLVVRNPQDLDRAFLTITRERLPAVAKSVRHLAGALQAMGYRVSRQLVAELLVAAGYSVLITIRRASRRPDPRRTPRRAHCTWCRDPQLARASTRTSLSFRISRRSSSGAGRAKVGFFLLRMALGVACSHSSPSIRSSR